MQFSKPKSSTEESCSLVDWPPIRRRPKEEGGSNDVPFKQNVCCLVLMNTKILLRSKLKYYTIRLPKVGRAENLNPQEAIPPFSLIFDSIQARKPETLV